MNHINRAPVHDLHISNGLTYVSLACGMGAMAAAVHADSHLAGACLAGAVPADTFDGRFARLFARTKRQAAAGGQIDSLVDACVFGMAPVTVLWMLAPPETGVEAGVWWAAALGYVLAAVTRLGFFNIESDSRLFVGVPTPAIGLIWSSVLLSTVSPVLVASLFVATAACMVAPIVVPRPRPRVLAAFAGWAAALVAVHALG